MENIGRLFDRIFMTVRKRTGRASHEAGLGPGEMRTMTFITRHPGTTQHEICSRFNINKAATARQCAALEEKGLIYREKNESDGRSQLLFPSEEALLKHKQHHLNEEKVYESIFDEALTEQEKEELYRLLSKVCEKTAPFKGERS